VIRGTDTRNWHSGGMQPSSSSADRSGDESTDESSQGQQLVCSAKECQQEARYAVVWNNPKVHTPDREKTWLACDQHREFLSGFVDKRGFLLRVDTL